MAGKRRILLVAGVSVILVALACVALFSGRHEPVYEGKGLTQWLRQYETEITTVGNQSTAGYDAIKHIGTNGIPILQQWLEAEDSPTKERIVGFIRAHPSLHMDLNYASEKRAMAFHGFMILGPIAKPAVPELIRIAKKQEKVSWPARTPVWFIDEEAARKAGLVHLIYP